MRIFSIKRIGGSTKYNNVKTVVDGITFDSRKESQRYQELKLLEKAGRIQDLKTQESFLLQPDFKRYGKKIRKIEYRADFTYRDKQGRKVVEDVKSAITKINPVYKMKKKMLLFLYEDIHFIET